MKRKEFESNLYNAVDIWGNYSKTQICILLGDAVGQMVGYQQCNPHHCYDLFQHTLHTVDGIPKEVSVLLKTAAFFHDVGKPEVARKKQERLVFYGHAKKSAMIAKPVLEKLEYSEDEIAEITFYIEHHDDFISWNLKNDEFERLNQLGQEITEANLEKHIEKMNKKQINYIPKIEQWKNLMLLCRADVSAQAEITLQNGEIIETKEHKLKKVEALIECLKNL